MTKTSSYTLKKLLEQFNVGTFQCALSLGQHSLDHKLHACEMLWFSEIIFLMSHNALILQSALVFMCCLCNRGLYVTLYIETV